MSFSDSSSLLSSPPSSDNEQETSKPAAPAPKTLKLKGGKLTAASGEASAPSSPEPQLPAREPSPPHEYVLADNPDIAFLVMFRARFSDVFPKNVPNLGPQDIENGVVESLPSEQIENFLCALLGLILNRKKYVERGHHGRALEEAISTHKSQWPRSWQGSNPLPGTKTFADLSPTERLSLLKTLVLWALNASDAITTIIKESYKQSRHDDDLNQPLSVQSWGNDGRKRRYWLIEGQNDTPFRLYRESPARIVNKTWWSVAGTIDDLKDIGENLNKEGSQAGRRLAERITLSIPRLEETQEKRKRKEYRQARRAAFLRPEPGYSLYEGRTRGKKMKYTFSDDEDFSESSSFRRSTRHSNGSASAELNGPTVTASGRQVRSRFGRSYGEPLGQSREGTATIESSEAGDPDANGSLARANGRPQRSTAAGYGKRARNGYSTDDELGDDDEDDSNPSGEEWQGDDDDVEGKLDEDDDDVDVSDNASDDSMIDVRSSLVVRLKYKKSPPELSMRDANGNENPNPISQGPSMSGSPPKPAIQSPQIVHRPKLPPVEGFHSEKSEQPTQFPFHAPPSTDAYGGPLPPLNQPHQHPSNGISAPSEDRPMNSVTSPQPLPSWPSSANHHQSPPKPIFSPQQNTPSWSSQGTANPNNHANLPAFQHFHHNTGHATSQATNNGYPQRHDQTSMPLSPLETNNRHPNIPPATEHSHKPTFPSAEAPFTAHPQSFGSPPLSNNQYQPPPTSWN